MGCGYRHRENPRSRNSAIPGPVGSIAARLERAVHAMTGGKMRVDIRTPLIAALMVIGMVAGVAAAGGGAGGGAGGAGAGGSAGGSASGTGGTGSSGVSGTGAVNGATSPGTSSTSSGLPAGSTGNSNISQGASRSRPVPVRHLVQVGKAPASRDVRSRSNPTPDRRRRARWVCRQRQS